MVMFESVYFGTENKKAPKGAAISGT